MKIVKITVWAADLPLSAPYWLSGGRLKFTRLDSTFLRMETDAGVCGWGEGCPWGHTYLPAYGGGIRAGMAIIAPAILGLDPRATDAINRAMDIALPGHEYVKSAADIACWDILGQCAELPLWKLLGGDAAAAVPVNSSISTGAPEEMVASVQKARADGYQSHSAKIGGDDTELDLARIAALESAREPDEKITYDINRAWTPSAAISVLNSVSARGWIEQPCETLEQCAHVAARTPQPILLDECLLSFADHLRAWRTDACEGIKIKPNRAGGLTKARRIRDFAVSVGWRMHIEDTGGSALADTAAIHLAASAPAENRLASWLCHAHLAADPVPGQGARNRNGFAAPPDKPGLGVIPDAESLGEPAAVYSL